MSNFFDMRCPKCGDEDHIDIAAEVWVRLTSDGTDADASACGDHIYTPESAAECGACGHHGTVAQFTPAQEGNAP
jgi:ribosomal protein S27E